MRPISTVPATLAAALLAALTAGCGDHVTDPAGFTESAEAEAVLRSAEALPSLPSLIAASEVDAADRATLQRARELWASGLSGDAGEARAKLRSSVRYAAPVLGRTLTATERAALAWELEAWIRTVESSLEHLTLPAVEARVRSAGRHLDGARAASSSQLATRHLLDAAADLAQTTPRFVARRLAAEATAAVDAALDPTAGPGAAAVSDVGTGAREPAARRARGSSGEVERARRLKDWAIRAVEEGEYLLAIQRAYYALQLLEDR